LQQNFQFQHNLCLKVYSYSGEIGLWLKFLHNPFYQKERNDWLYDCRAQYIKSLQNVKVWGSMQSLSSLAAREMYRLKSLHLCIVTHDPPHYEWREVQTLFYAQEWCSDFIELTWWWPLQLLPIDWVQGQAVSLANTLKLWRRGNKLFLNLSDFPRLHSVHLLPSFQERLPALHSPSAAIWVAQVGNWFRLQRERRCNKGPQKVNYMPTNWMT
jgi:hypothetical protein